MPSAKRQFLHLLAEDYGLESASEDTEPHRYVVVYKGPRFVSAPNKTIAQCVKIREKQAAAAASAKSSIAPAGAVTAADPFNALLLISPRFGLTVEEVCEALGNDFSSQPSLHFSVHFLPTEEVLIRASAPYSAFLSPSATEQTLTNLKRQISETISRAKLASNVILCHASSAEHVSRRENFSKPDASGWSAVAGRAATKVAVVSEEPTAKGTGRRLLGLKKKKVEKEPDKPTWAAQLDGDVEC
jgi:transcriptional repressor NF-X1